MLGSLELVYFLIACVKADVGRDALAMEDALMEETRCQGLSASMQKKHARRV